MQFSSSFVLAALPFLAAAQPHLINARGDATTAYALTAMTHDGDEVVDNHTINAANNGFFIGAKPSNTCPSGVTCPSGTDTSVLLADSMASLVRKAPTHIEKVKNMALTIYPPIIRTS